MEDIMDRQPSAGVIQVTQLYQDDSTATWRKSAAGHHTKTPSSHSFPPYFCSVLLLLQICHCSVSQKTQTLEVYFPFSAIKTSFPLPQMNYVENRRGSFHGQKDVASVRQFWKKGRSFQSHRSTKLAKAGTPGHHGFHLSQPKPKQVDHADIIYVQPINITVAACNAVWLKIYMLSFLL